MRRAVLPALMLLAAAAPAIAQSQPAPEVRRLQVTWDPAADDLEAAARSFAAALGERRLVLCEQPAGEVFLVGRSGDFGPEAQAAVEGPHGAALAFTLDAAPPSPETARAALSDCVAWPRGPVGARFPEAAWRLDGADFVAMLDLRQRYALALAEVGGVDDETFVSFHVGTPLARALTEAMLGDLRARGLDPRPCAGEHAVDCAAYDAYRAQVDTALLDAFDDAP